MLQRRRSLILIQYITLSSRALLKDLCTFVLACDCPTWRETRLLGNTGFPVIFPIAPSVQKLDFHLSKDGPVQPNLPTLSLVTETFTHMFVGLRRPKKVFSELISRQPSSLDVRNGRFGSSVGPGSAVIKRLGLLPAFVLASAECYPWSPCLGPGIDPRPDMS
jgi:hypothetical protein